MYTPKGLNINGMGYGNQNLNENNGGGGDGGGNASRGVLDQARPTGFVATGGRARRGRRGIEDTIGERASSARMPKGRGR
jgi:hypothetical protein